MDWAPWVVLPAIFAAALVSAHLGHRGRVRSLRALAAGLEKGTADVHAGFFATLHDCSVEGQLDGRAVRVTFERGSGSRSPSLARLRVAVRHPAATFEVTDAGALTKLGRWLGLSSDPLGLADREVRGGSEQAGSLLQATAVHDGLRLLLVLPGVRKVALGTEALEVELEVPGDLALLHPVLLAMAALARPCDRAPFAGRADALAARFAWTGGDSSARCPYCKDDLTAEVDVVGCERCHTVHHRECLAEAGGCTVFGCRARDGGPARARA